MIKGKKLIVCLLCVALSLPVLAWADEVAELKKQLMFDQKKLIVMQNMEFTADEGKRFWPVYEDLQKELFDVNQRAAKLILAYASVYQTMTDEQAAKIVAEYFDIQKGRIDTLNRYAIELAKGLPAKKVFRLAKGIPLAQ
jgi:hypothetical protein